MNVGEKICLYRERLGFKDFGDFAKSAGIPNGWLYEMSKKESIKMVDMGHLLKLCLYLGITIEQLVSFEDIKVEQEEALDKSDMSVILKEIIFTLENSKDVRLDGIKLNDKAREILKDSLEVCKQLTRQYL